MFDKTDWLQRILKDTRLYVFLIVKILLIVFIHHCFALSEYLEYLENPNLIQEGPHFVVLFIFCEMLIYFVIKFIVNILLIWMIVFNAIVIIRNLTRGDD